MFAYVGLPQNLKDLKDSHVVAHRRYRSARQNEWQEGPHLAQGDGLRDLGFEVWGLGFGVWG